VILVASTLPSAFADGGETAPLDRLKQRSAKNRWDVLSKQLPKLGITRKSKAKNGSSKPAASRPLQALPDDLDQVIRPFRLAALQESEKKETEPYPEPVRDPMKLRKITTIMPYFDYEPDEKLRKEDPCSNICPRPDGAPCKPAEDGTGLLCPEEVQLSKMEYSGRMFEDSLFQWKAPDLYSNPLYFEDPSLERYGHTHHEVIQPFVSAGRFGVQLFGLPYQMTIDPICKRMYALGYYRPGECTPKKYYRVPWNTEAAVRQAGVVTGLFYIIP